MKSLVFTATLGLTSLLTSAHAEEGKMLTVTQWTKENYREEVFQYPGAVITLISNSTEADSMMNRRKKVFASLAESFGDHELDGHKIKFIEFDFQGYVPGKEERGMLALSMSPAVDIMIMYRKGKELDRIVCGPENGEGEEDMIRILQTYWVPLNLTEPREAFTGLYKGGCVINPVQKETGEKPF